MISNKINTEEKPTQNGETMKPLYFQCYKCSHKVFTDDINKIKKLPNMDCPDCGEEGYKNWIVLGEIIL